MNVLRRAFDFFIFSNLYISLCAVLMVFQTSRLLLHTPVSLNLICFVFLSTVCSYNFHWYLTTHSLKISRRIQWTRQNKPAHLVLCIAGLAGATFFFFTLKSHWMALTLAAFITFLYSAPKLPLPFFNNLRKIAIGKTIFLSFAWMYVTAVLPVFVAGKTWQTEYGLFAMSRFLLIYAICIIFDYRDREDDKHDGIRSMITYLGEKGINILFSLTIILFAVSTIALYTYNYTAYTIFILLAPGLIVAGLYNYAKKNYSDYLYYFVLDGLMMFSGLLVLVVKI